MIDLTINPELARRILTGFIRTEITRTGLAHAVINLSGGIDSALSCFLAAEALGPQNVLAIRLPYQTSSVDSLEHAQMVIDADDRSLRPVGCFQGSGGGDRQQD
jgi:NAD+ synthase